MCPLLFPTLCFGASLSPTSGHGRSTPHHHHHRPAPLLLLLKPLHHPSSLTPRSTPTPLAMAAMTTTATTAASSSFLHRRPAGHRLVSLRAWHGHCHHRYRLACRAAEVSGAESSAAPAAAEAGGGGSASWVPVVPLAALPRGERRVIYQDGEEILLLWYKDQVFAIENRSPAEGAYTEGLLNAKLTQVRPERLRPARRMPFCRRAVLVVIGLFVILYVLDTVSKYSKKKRIPFHCMQSDNHEQY